MIGNLTNDMMRLCGEITALRDSRAILRGRLSQSRDELKDAVSQKQAELRNSREEMADRTRNDLRNFVGTVQDTVTELKQSVAAFREEFLGDLAGARRAWCGHDSMRTPFRTAAEEQPNEFVPKGKRKKH